LRSKIWSMDTETQWYERLVSLRTFHDPVKQKFIYIGDLLLNNNRGLDLKRFIHVCEQIALLKDELSIEATVMKDEAKEMQRLKMEYPQAVFLTDIEESAERVSDAASKLHTEIEEVEKELKKGEERSINLVQLNHCQSCFVKLEKLVDEIPTVMDLKLKYQHEY
ncbi:hypothetical protein PMAYCL1PPCAC_13094, partial [Pristionchus mayeri]